MVDRGVTDKSADRIGAFPSAYDASALPMRRIAAYARWATVIAVTEAFALAAMAFAIAGLMPLQKVVPMIVGANTKGDEIVRLNPITIDAPSRDYVTEINLRQYVTARYRIGASASEQAMAWGANSPIQLMSSVDAYKAFEQIAQPEYARLRTSGLVRNVHIDSVRKISETIWQVEFTTTDQPEASAFGAAPQGDVHLWVTSFRVGYERKNITYEDRLINPLGFTVYEIHDSKRD